ncbi:MAG: hypothetical protein ACOYNZ_04030 [Rhodoferax sp.]
MKRLMLLTAIAAMTACGGGGGGSNTTAPVNGTAEGFWNGTITGGYSASVAILENGETWGAYSSGNSLVGAIYGQTSSSDASLSGSGSFFNFVRRQSGAGTYTGSVSPKSTINFTTNGGDRFTGNYSATYDQPASLASLAGSYSGFSVTGTTSAQSTPIVISSTGAISGVALGCTATGTAKPRASGKNIFDVQLSFSGTCALGNGASTSGIAYYDVTTRQVGVITLNSSKTDGLIYLGTR